MGKLCLFPVLCFTVFVVSTFDPTKLSSLQKRVNLDDNEANLITGNFDVTNWPNLAEQDCYIALCLLDGRRV